MPQLLQQEGLLWRENLTELQAQHHLRSPSVNWLVTQKDLNNDPQSHRLIFRTALLCRWSNRRRPRFMGIVLLFIFLRTYLLLFLLLNMGVWVWPYASSAPKSKFEDLKWTVYLQWTCLQMKVAAELPLRKWGSPCGERGLSLINWTHFLSWSGKL